LSIWPAHRGTATVPTVIPLVPGFWMLRTTWPSRCCRQMSQRPSGAATRPASRNVFQADPISCRTRRRGVSSSGQRASGPRTTWRGTSTRSPVVIPIRPSGPMVGEPGRARGQGDCWPTIGVRPGCRLARPNTDQRPAVGRVAATSRAARSAGWRTGQRRPLVPVDAVRHRKPHAAPVACGLPRPP
jgi:hypothetical protein